MKLKQKQPTESEITRGIRQYLKLKGIFHWKVWQGLGSTPGVPDIVGICRGRFVGIEVKTAKGKLSEHQEQFRDAIVREGGLYILARSTDDVATVFERKEAQP
jgi:Holliday junction resolvase